MIQVSKLIYEHQTDRDNRETVTSILQAQQHMKPEQHDINCPVFKGEALDCDWPERVCVPADFEFKVVTG